MDVTVEVVEGGGSEVALNSDDWKTISNADFLSRLSPDYRGGGHLTALSSMVRPIVEDDGRVVGRAVLREEFLSDDGAIIDTGFRVGRVSRIAGVLFGTVTNAARSDGNVSVSLHAIRRWASDQAALLSKHKGIDDGEKLSASATLGALGVNIRQLPIVRRGQEFWSKKRFVSHIKSVKSLQLIGEDVLVHDDEDECSSSSYDSDFELRDDFFIFPEVSAGWMRHFDNWQTSDLSADEKRLAQTRSGADLNIVLLMRLVAKVWGKLTWTRPTVIIGEVHGTEILRIGHQFAREKKKLD